MGPLTGFKIVEIAGIGPPPIGAMLLADLGATVLRAIGRAGGPPTPPLNLVGDFGGGALYLALGIACGLLEAQRSGNGQVVDAAMTDGAASLMTMYFGMRAGGQMTLERGSNILDSGAFFYEGY